MIRRVQRWGAEPWFPEFVGVGKRSLHYTKPFILEYDDGEPEMTKKIDPAPCPLCGYAGAGYYQAATHPCVLHAVAKTKDRVVEGMWDEGRTAKFHPRDGGCDTRPFCIPATVIIHEPVKEPTLVEAVERYLHVFNSSPSPASDLPDARAEMRAAVEREKKGKA